MLRVTDLERSVAFYTKALGMNLFRREEYPEGRFTLAFVGYGEEWDDPALELTHNWDEHRYDKGTAYGHVALSTVDLHGECKRLESLGVRVVRQPGPMANESPHREASEVIAFIEDPDGYRIELIQQRA
jgi:lactoylglutathione lyase